MKKSALDYETIAKWGLGGVAGGSALSALYHYIRDFKRLNSEADSTADDDDVLYIKGKRQEDGEKAASQPIDSSGFGKFLKYTAGAGGLVAGYKGVAKLYDIIREKQLQSELDNAQVAYIEALEEKRDADSKKYASFNKEAFLSDAQSGVYGAMLLLALASGVVSYKTLDKAFPGRSQAGRVKGRYRPVGGRTIKRKRSQHFPKEIQVLADDGSVQETIDTNQSGDTDADAIEGLIRTTTSDEERSKAAGFDDLIAAVADGRSREIKSNLEYGIDHTFNMIKGAAENKPSPARESFAIGLLAKDPMLKAAFGPLFASEYRDMSPYIFHSAALLPEEDKEFLSKVASYHAMAFRQARISEDSSVMEKLSSVDLTKSSSALLAPLVDAMALEDALDEGTSFFSQGEDSYEGEYASEEDVEESEEEPEESTDTDELDEFFSGTTAEEYDSEEDEY